MATIYCPRCRKSVRYVVTTYWGGVNGALCPACCNLAERKFDASEWPPFPQESNTTTRIEN